MTLHNLDLSLSLLSYRFNNNKTGVLAAIYQMTESDKQLISIGRRTTSERFIIMYEIHSWTKGVIFKKSDEIKTEITFFKSNTGWSGGAESIKFWKALLYFGY